MRSRLRSTKRSLKQMQEETKDCEELMGSGRDAQNNEKWIKIKPNYKAAAC